MEKIGKVLACTLAFALIMSFAASSALAKNDKSKSKSKSEKSLSHGSAKSDSSTPPGWSKGQKTGWGEGKYPPGWSKWDDGKKTKWRSDRTLALDDIDGVCRKHGIGEEERSKIRQGFDEAIAGGLIIDDARKKLVSGLADEKQRRIFMVDTTQSVLEYLK
ncbi:MAG: hypothetical protein WC683_11615 [bacterium]